MQCCSGLASSAKLHQMCQLRYFDAVSCPAEALLDPCGKTAEGLFRGPKCTSRMSAPDVVIMTSVCEVANNQTSA